jgi:DNA-binding ferritin-like protein
MLTGRVGFGPRPSRHARGTMPLPFASLVPLPEVDRTQGIALIQPIVDSGIALSLVLLHAHWNVKGASFGPLHDLFGELYTLVTGLTDDVAEHIGALGGTPSAFTVIGATASPLVQQFIQGSASQDGLVFCRLLAPLLQAFYGQIDAAYNVTTAAKSTAVTTTFQDAVLRFGKLGWKVINHVPDLKLPEPGAPTPAAPTAG